MADDVRGRLLVPLRDAVLLAEALRLWVLPPLLADDVVFFVPPVFRAVEVGFFVPPERLEEVFFVCAMYVTPYALSLNQMRMDITPTAQQ